MSEFLGEHFLLQTKVAQRLYHEYAAGEPIYDYHCHVSPREIAEDRKFESITQVWLGGDHYKWRVMRANGYDESYITGSRGDWEKFEAWAQTIPYTIGNPLHQWTHLELRRYFGIDEILSPESARGIYKKCNELLATDQFSVRQLIKRMKVSSVCTTDDPLDSLEFHRQLQEDVTFPVDVYPAFRPDAVFKTADPDSLNNWLDGLSLATGQNVDSFEELMGAIESRINFFHSMGCRLSDHGISEPYVAEYTAGEVEAIFQELRSGALLSSEKSRKYCAAIFLELGKMYAAKGWVMQLHLSALRNNSSRNFAKMGADIGLDSMDDVSVAKPLVEYLDSLDKSGSVPKTILYSLNPVHNDLLAAVCGSFQDGSIPGKMQLGTAWWFNDQRDGMEKQMTALANSGLLRRFVGMVTDSRSFLSYPRHEYFRRVLCNLIGTWVEKGEVPNDIELLGQMVRDICFFNAKNYFKLGEDTWNDSQNF